jgi:hypothetical protein
LPKGRPMEQSCETCRFRDKDDLCRHSPPRAGNYNVAVFPKVRGNCYCHQWQRGVDTANAEIENQKYGECNSYTTSGERAHQEQANTLEMD